MACHSGFSMLSLRNSILILDAENKKSSLILVYWYDNMIRQWWDYIDKLIFAWYTWINLNG